MGPTALRIDAVYNGSVPLLINFAPIAAATNGDNAIVAAVTGKKIRVMQLFVQAGAAGNIYFTDGTTVVFGGNSNTINLAINGNVNLNFSPIGWFETGVGAGLTLHTSSTGPFGGGLAYITI